MGSQVEVTISCSNINFGATGVFGIDVLGTASMDEATRLGVNLSMASAGETRNARPSLEYDCTVESRIPE